MSLQTLKKKKIGMTGKSLVLGSCLLESLDLGRKAEG